MPKRCEWESTDLVRAWRKLLGRCGACWDKVVSKAITGSVSDFMQPSKFCVSTFNFQVGTQHRA